MSSEAKSNPLEAELPRPDDPDAMDRVLGDEEENFQIKDWIFWREQIWVT